MIKIGMMIGDRYEILEKIGTGGMSDVYKAKCHKLNRYVAIKVLKQEFSENAIENGFGVIIAAAGMAAHLGGVLAASTTLPVIGIPCSAKVLDGMDAMLATVMMPPGVPVATVGVNAAKNAALLAAEIIAVGNDDLMQKLIAMRKDMADAVVEKDKALQEKIKEL